MRKSRRMIKPLNIIGVQPFSAKRFLIAPPENGCYANENQHDKAASRKNIFSLVGFRQRYTMNTTDIL